MRRHLLKENATALDLAQRIVDPLIVIAAGIVAYRLKFDSWDLNALYVNALLAVTLLAIAAFPSLMLYHSQRGASFAEEVRTLFLAWLAIAVTGGVFVFLTKTGPALSREWALNWMVGGFAAHVASRAAVRVVLRAMRLRGHNLRHIVIVGAGTHGREIAVRLKAAPWSGLNVRGFYDDDRALEGNKFDGVPVIGLIDSLADDLAREDRADQVWIALPLHAENRIREVLNVLRNTTAVVRFVPDIQSFHLLHHSVTEIAGLPVLNITDSPHTGIDSTLKALEDLLLASTFLVINLPFWAVIAIGVKISSPGPVFYRQDRVTWNGQQFQMLKFRSMPQDSEADSGPVWSRTNEARATRFGTFLRRYSLDELPQLLNVLRGDMSLVGPRPERPEFVREFRQLIPGYMQKHLVKAGITGWAQVNDLRGDSDLEQRIQYDLYYIDNWSLWFDLRILALTLWHILTSRNAH
jgi:putative colanic acid biosysnthesis UDP-glucose lipid carrier transferase